VETQDRIDVHTNVFPVNKLERLNRKVSDSHHLQKPLRALQASESPSKASSVTPQTLQNPQTPQTPQTAQTRQGGPSRSSAGAVLDSALEESWTEAWKVGYVDPQILASGLLQKLLRSLTTLRSLRQ